MANLDINSSPRTPSELAWPAVRLRTFGEKVLAIAADFLDRLETLPVTTQATRDAIRGSLADPPQQPLSDDELLMFLSRLFQDSTHTAHPHFLAYITGSGTAPDAYASFIAAVLNQNVGGWATAPAATEIELRLMQWLAHIFGLPPATAGGLIEPGGAISNLTALKVARDFKLGYSCRATGVRCSRPAVIYSSEERHPSIDRAADLLGLGTSALRAIPTDAFYRLRLDLLEDAIRSDIREGILPLAVVATAGTTATGSIDPLAEVAHLCSKYSLWLHVDAAYGGGAMLSPRVAHLLGGIERADSITFDAHKWFYISLPASCTIFRDFACAGRSFSIDASYTPPETNALDLSDYGPAWSRGFDALRIWLPLLSFGTEAFTRRIAEDVELAHYLESEILKRQDLELMAPVALSICCFRYVPPLKARSPYDLNLLNEGILAEIRRIGSFFCSSAVLEERFVLRVCIVNYRTERAHLDALLQCVVETGRRLTVTL